VIIKRSLSKEELSKGNVKGFYGDFYGLAEVFATAKISKREYL